MNIISQISMAAVNNGGICDELLLIYMREARLITHKTEPNLSGMVVHYKNNCAN